MKLVVRNYLNTLKEHVNYYGDETYVIISCQDSRGFGFTFNPTDKCLDVLTLYFDDADTAQDESCLFSDSQAQQIVEFVEKYKDQVSEIWVHCYAGMSRSQAVAAALDKFYSGSDDKYFQTATPNMRVYRKVLEALYNQN